MSGKIYEITLVGAGIFLSILLIVNATYYITIPIFFSIYLFYFYSIRKRKEHLLLSFVLFFLPLYPAIRSLLLINIPDINLPINYLRDVIIIALLIITTKRIRINTYYKAINKNRNFRLMSFSMMFLLANYIYGLIVSITNGFYELGIKGIHLNVIPLIMIIIVLNLDFALKEFDEMLRFILVLGLISASIGINFYFHRPSFFGEIFAAFRQFGESPIEVINYSRMVGAFLSPNVFGAFMAIILIISINELFEFRTKKYRVFLVVVSIATSVGLVLSLSRGAWMYGIGGIITILYFNSQKIIINKKSVIVITFILFICIILLSNSNIIEILFGRIISLFDIKNNSSYGRFDNWVSAFKSLCNNLFGFGLGVGGINLYYHPLISEKIKIQVIDGFYIKTIVETGLLGVMFFLTHIVLLIKGLAQSIKIEQASRKYFVLSLAIFIGALFQAFGSNIFDFVTIAPYIWLIIGIGIKLSLDNEREGKQ